MPLPSLTIVISTIDKNSDCFLKNFQFENLKDADEVIIVIQGVEKFSPNPILRPFTVISDSDYGLSKSRNIGIENSNSDFIWFLDDDVYLIEGSVKKLKNFFKLIAMQIYILLESAILMTLHIKSILIMIT